MPLVIKFIYFCSDFLFKEIYGRFVGSIQYKEIFLESLEPYILADK